MDYTASDIVSCYTCTEGQSRAKLNFKKGVYELPAELDMGAPGLDMISTSFKIVVANRNEDDDMLNDILLDQNQICGLAVIMRRPARQNWVIILNSIVPFWYDDNLVRYCEGLKDILEIYSE